MDSHDEIKENPQEISSGLNSEANRNNNTDKSSGLSAKNASFNSNDKKQITGLWDRDDSNPYSFTPYSENKKKNERFEDNLISAKGKSGVFKQFKNKVFSQNSDSESRKQKGMVLLVPVLAVVFVFVVRQVLIKPPSKSKADDDKKSAVSVENKKSGNSINWKIPEPLPVVMRDISTVGNAGSTSDNNQTEVSDGQADILYIRSIVHSNDSSSVVIGSRIFHLNDQINGATIVEIGKDFVVFEKDGVREVKKVAEESVHTPQITKNKKENIN